MSKARSWTDPGLYLFGFEDFAGEFVCRGFGPVVFAGTGHPQCSVFGLQPGLIALIFVSCNAGQLDAIWMVMLQWLCNAIYQYGTRPVVMHV